MRYHIFLVKRLQKQAKTIIIMYNKINRGLMDYPKFFSDLKTLISFKSVLGKAQENAPFGIENKKALEFFLSLAKNFGFECINYDNYGGEFYYGEGEEVGIIGHLDVVPVGLGWNTDPFKLTEIDNVLYGRGTEDDKTPCLLCLYALKELKDEGVKFNRKIRFFVGCNEETGWKDVEYMKTKTTFPVYGFSPDSNFPVCYAEKGIYRLRINLPKFKHFKNLKGGTATNAVCDYASVEADSCAIDSDLLNKYNLKLTDGLIESFGVPAHGAYPEKGKNAFAPLLKYMEDMGEELFSISTLLFDDGLGLSSLVNEQGAVTLSPNVIIKEDGGDILVCDCRVPAPFTKNTVYPYFEKIKLPYTLIEVNEPFMADKGGWLVNALLSAYNEVTGENALPVAQRGSTFARVFKVGCGFGFGDDNGTKGCHEANESITISHLKKSYEIYKKAIYNLVK